MEKVEGGGWRMQKVEGGGWRVEGGRGWRAEGMDVRSTCMLGHRRVQSAACGTGGGCGTGGQEGAALASSWPIISATESGVPRSACKIPFNSINGGQFDFVYPPATTPHAVPQYREVR